MTQENSEKGNPSARVVSESEAYLSIGRKLSFWSHFRASTKDAKARVYLKVDLNSRI